MQQCGGGEGEEGVEVGRGVGWCAKEFQSKESTRGNEAQNEARGRNGGKWGGGQTHSDTEEAKKKNLAGRPKKKHEHTVTECEECKNEKSSFLLNEQLSPHALPHDIHPSIHFHHLSCT